MKSYGKYVEKRVMEWPWTATRLEDRKVHFREEMCEDHTAIDTHDVYQADSIL